MQSLEQKARERIINRRKNKDLTQEVLAKLVGISKKRLNEIENGKAGIGLDLAEKLAAALECSPVDLLFPGEVPAPIVKDLTPQEMLERITVIIKAYEKEIRDLKDPRRLHNVQSPTVKRPESGETDQLIDRVAKLGKAGRRQLEKAIDLFENADKLTAKAQIKEEK